MGAQRRVVCAACKFAPFDRLVVGPRHFDKTMHAQMTEGMQRSSGDAEQGFIDQWGTFMTREQAWRVAEVAGQILYRVGGDYNGTLYSENLY